MKKYIVTALMSVLIAGFISKSALAAPHAEDLIKQVACLDFVSSAATPETMPSSYHITTCIC